MGVRILADRDDGTAIMYSSTTDWAFGPVIQDEDSATEKAEAFINWLADDPREYEDNQLEKHWYEFCKEYAKRKKEEG